MNAHRAQQSIVIYIQQKIWTRTLEIAFLCNCAPPHLPISKSGNLSTEDLSRSSYWLWWRQRRNSCAHKCGHGTRRTKHSIHRSRKAGRHGAPQWPLEIPRLVQPPWCPICRCHIPVYENYITKLWIRWVVMRVNGRTLNVMALALSDKDVTIRHQEGRLETSSEFSGDHQLRNLRRHDRDAIRADTDPPTKYCWHHTRTVVKEFKARVRIWHQPIML